MLALKGITYLIIFYYRLKNNPNDIYVDDASIGMGNRHQVGISFVLLTQRSHSDREDDSGPHRSTYNLYGILWTTEANIIEYSVQNLPANNGATFIVDTQRPVAPALQILGELCGPY